MWLLLLGWRREGRVCRCCHSSWAALGFVEGLGFLGVCDVTDSSCVAVTASHQTHIIMAPRQGTQLQQALIAREVLQERP